MLKVVSRRRLGFQRERELVRKFWKLGFACMRGPASGSKTKKTPYPDLVAIKNGKVFVVEVKTREKRGTIYVPDDQLQKVVEFAWRAKGYALVAVKYMDGSGWKFVPVDKLDKTPSGLWRITPKLVAEGLTLEDINRIAVSTKTLEEYLKTIGEGDER